MSLSNSILSSLLLILSMTTPTFVLVMYAGMQYIHSYLTAMFKECWKPEISHNLIDNISEYYVMDEIEEKRNNIYDHFI